MKEMENWWKQAKRDLETAKNNINSGDYYAASFFCQQAVEKALKAFYIKRFKEVKKIHNIVILAKELKLPAGLIKKCDELNPIYIDTRYPDAADNLPSERYDEEKSNKDIRSAGDVLKWLEKKI